MKAGDKVRYKNPRNKADAEREFVLAETPKDSTFYIRDANQVFELVTMEDIEVIP